MSTFETPALRAEHNRVQELRITKEHELEGQRIRTVWLDGCSLILSFASGKWAQVDVDWGYEQGDAVFALDGDACTEDLVEANLFDRARQDRLVPGAG